MSSVKYYVERTQPPDGLLGAHEGAFDIETLGKTYGEGTYKVTKVEKGRSAMDFTQKVSPTYGPPRLPKQGVAK